MNNEPNIRDLIMINHERKTVISYFLYVTDHNSFMQMQSIIDNYVLGLGLGLSLTLNHMPKPIPNPST